MYRVIAIVCAGVALTACSSTPDWMKFNTDAFKPKPTTDTVRFESEPPGAEAKVSNGQACRTPCSLALPDNAKYSVVFNLNGYQPESDTIENVSMGDGTNQLRPNPVLVELTPAAPPPPKSKAKPAPKKKPTAAKPKPAPAASANAPANQAQTPWPSNAPAAR